MAASLFGLGRIPGIDRPAIAVTLPTIKKPIVVIDGGANSNCTPEMLYQFAIMGATFSKNVLGIEHPRIGVLNIGEEAGKGNELAQATYKLLEEHSGKLNFVGNIEGKEILDGDVDVIVTDGFTGNVALKTTEGVAKVLVKSLKESLMSSTRTKVGALMAKPGLKQLMKKFDTKAAGGALMMGFEKPVIKAHGSSDAIAFENAINLAFEMVSSNVVEKMKEGLK